MNSTVCTNQRGLADLTLAVAAAEDGQDSILQTCELQFSGNRGLARHTDGKGANMVWSADIQNERSSAGARSRFPRSNVFGGVLPYQIP